VSWVAGRVEISDWPAKDANRGRIMGAVSQVDMSGATLTVLGMTVLTDVTTRFEGIVGLSALTPGLVVEIEGELGANGQLSASHVGVVAPALGGTVQSVAPSGTDLTINVLGQPITVNAQTVVVKRIHHGHHGEHGDDHH
jgi:hypothetical protein